MPRRNLFGLGYCSIGSMGMIYEVASIGPNADNYAMKPLPRASLLALISTLLSFSLIDSAAALESGLLAEAASRGDVSEVKALLGMGVHPDEPDRSGQTALGFATLLGHVELIDVLCEAGADPNLVGPEGLNSLMTAVQAFRHDLVIILLKYGADVNFVSDLVGAEEVPVSALSLAINRRDYDVVRLLISEGARASRLSELVSKTPNPLNLPSVEIALDYRIWRNLFFLRDFANSPNWDASAAVGDDRWVLHRAARDHDFKLLENSIRAGGAPSRIDVKGVSPLMVAAWHGNRSGVALLLRNGADLLGRDVMGRDALCYATAGGDVAIVRRLLGALGKNAADAADEFNTKLPTLLPTDEIFMDELESLQEQDYDGVTPENAPSFAIDPIFTPGADMGVPEDKEITPIPANSIKQSELQSDVHEVDSFESSPLYYALATGNNLVLDMLLSAKFTDPIEDEEGVDPLMMAAWLTDLYAVKKLAARYSSKRIDLAGRTALAWSAAAFARDRTIARDSRYLKLPTRNYPIVRFLCARQRNPRVYDPEPTTELHHSAIEAWNPGVNLDDADYWRQLNPPPVPSLPGDGDRILYQIFRDEEHDIPDGN